MVIQPIGQDRRLEYQELDPCPAPQVKQSSGFRYLGSYTKANNGCQIGSLLVQINASVGKSLGAVDRDVSVAKWSPSYASHRLRRR